MNACDSVDEWSAPACIDCIHDVENRCEIYIAYLFSKSIIFFFALNQAQVLYGFDICGNSEFALCDSHLRSKLDRGRLPELTMISGGKVLSFHSRLF